MGTRFPFTNLVLPLYILGSDTSPGEACHGSNAHLSACTIKGLWLKALHWGCPGVVHDQTLTNIFEKPPPQMKIPLWETCRMYWTRIKSVKHQKGKVCPSRSIKHRSPSPTRTITTTERFTGKDCLKAVKMGYLARLILTFYLSPCGLGWVTLALNLLKDPLNTANGLKVAFL